MYFFIIISNRELYSLVSAGFSNIGTSFSIFDVLSLLVSCFIFYFIFKSLNKNVPQHLAYKKYSNLMLIKDFDLQATIRKKDHCYRKRRGGTLFPLDNNWKCLLINCSEVWGTARQLTSEILDICPPESLCSRLVVQPKQM